MSLLFGEKISIYPVLASDDIVATTTRTVYVDTNLAHKLAFLISVGDLTTGAGATCDSLVLTVEASSIVTSGSAVAINYNYRLSSAIGTNSWGAITAGTSDGTSFSCSDIENSLILVEVDPCILPAISSIYRWIGLCLTPSSTTLLTLGVNAFIQHRYPGNSIPSST